LDTPRRQIQFTAELIGICDRSVGLHKISRL